MYSDVPVITSNVTSMPEVAGEAALLTDPRNPESIATAMMQLATDPELYRLLIEKGRHRRLYFSWEKTAERLWESILRTVNPPNN